MNRLQSQKLFLNNLGIGAFLLAAIAWSTATQAKSPVSKSADLSTKTTAFAKPQPPPQEIIPNWKDLQSLETLTPEKKQIIWNIFCDHKEQIKDYKSKLQTLRQVNRKVNSKAALQAQSGKTPSITLGEAILLGSIEQGEPDTQLGEDNQYINPEQQAVINTQKKIAICKRRCWQSIKKQLSPQEIKEATRIARKRQQQQRKPISALN
jgi:hypothetical protein